jgi:GH25 family lysozyme M1 (1,4-beta-N-acetylmuramidase)
MIVDVSKFQGQIDWDAVKASGIEGAILRAVSTNSNGLYKDPYFDRNYTECKRLGIPVGAYYYTYATNKDYADRELALFKTCIEGRQFELPIVLDVEDKLLTQISASALTDLAIYALDRIEKWGCYAMWYTDLNFRKNHLVPSRLASYDYWCAYWSANKPSVAYGIWQYTSDGSVSGINGRVDLNRTDRDYPSIIKKAGLNGFSKEEPVVEPDPEPTPEPIPDPTPEPDPDFTDREKSIIVKIIRFLIKLIGGLE